MRLIALYLVTLIVYFISFSVLSYLTDKEAFEEQEDDELSVVSSELKYFIFFLLLYCVGILSYVLLPALGKGEFLTAAGAGLIYSIITNTGADLVYS